MDMMATRTVQWLGTTYTLVLSKPETGGAFALVDSVTEPGYGPPRHVHQKEDEAFFVLSGDVEFWTKDGTVVKGPGEAVFLPRGVEHTFRVAGDQPARMLTMLTPGGFEEYFLEMGRNKYRIPEDMGAVAGSAAVFGITFTGPPL
ncbi:cupin domain-containing protein [Rhizobium mesosinicum]|uniref:Cupin domain-containing protein n=1 Tax=Rhizobium mesosinicum TaxID=335017 RepID=A0ABS7GZW9_9HYPH|nr:cupin domain-containing protein [Rhizobium mesosinicum]MBW9055535.1 cupin domain-containing protein [Rhizobium mesosinicum]